MCVLRGGHGFGSDCGGNTICFTFTRGGLENANGHLHPPGTFFSRGREKANLQRMGRRKRLMKYVTQMRDPFVF